MGRMTGKTAFGTGDRSMVECNLLVFFIMAIKTERVNLLENKLWGLRGMGLMAGVAHPLFEGRMVHRSPTLQLITVMTVIAKLASCPNRAEGFGI